MKTHYFLLGFLIWFHFIGEEINIRRSSDEILGLLAICVFNVLLCICAKEVNPPQNISKEMENSSKKNTSKSKKTS